MKRRYIVLITLAIAGVLSAIPRTSSDGSVALIGPYIYGQEALDPDTMPCAAMGRSIDSYNGWPLAVYSHGGTCTRAIVAIGGVLGNLAIALATALIIWFSTKSIRKGRNYNE